MTSPLRSCSLLAVLVLATVCRSAAESVERPCGDANSVDTDCVRAQLAARSGCTPVTTVEGLDPYPAPEVYIWTNYFNATILKPNHIFTGLSNSFVVDYYIDTANDLNVLLIKHPNVTGRGPMNIYFHRAGQASLNVTTKIDESYSLLTTLLIPGTETVDLNRRQSYFLQTDPAAVTFGDDNLQSYVDSNELVASVIQAAYANEYPVIQDALYSMTKVIVDGFVNQALCSLPSREPLYQVPIL